jgi:DNA-binding beta-propeller fold protein YncE
VDGLNERVYWSMGNTVRRANLDGSNAEVISYVEDPWLIQDLALDNTHGAIYIANWSAVSGTRGNLQRVDLDGSNLEDLVTGILNGPIGLAVDPDAGKVYWGKNAEDAESGRVMRANLDGTDGELVIAYVDPDSLALDLAASRVYWTDLDVPLVLLGTIQRANFDGTEHETLPLGEMYLGGIAIVSDTGPSCPGDLDGDNDVDIADLAQLLGHYGLTEGASYEDGDLDGDGDVDISDLAGLLGVYGTVCE